MDQQKSLLADLPRVVWVYFSPSVHINKALDPVVSGHFLFLQRTPRKPFYDHLPNTIPNINQSSINYPALISSWVCESPLVILLALCLVELLHHLSYIQHRTDMAALKNRWMWLRLWLFLPVSLWAMQLRKWYSPVGVLLWCAGVLSDD